MAYSPIKTVQPLFYFSTPPPDPNVLTQNIQIQWPENREGFVPLGRGFEVPAKPQHELPVVDILLIVTCVTTLTGEVGLGGAFCSFFCPPPPSKKTQSGVVSS